MDAREALDAYADESCESDHRYDQARRAFDALYRVLDAADAWGSGCGPECELGCAWQAAAEEARHVILTVLTGDDNA